MAEFVDVEDFDNAPLEVTDQVPVQEEEVVPEKYAGKTTAEIVRMHQEAEKLIGRQGSEVGELRHIVDDFIRSQTKSKEVEEAQIEDTDYFTDPQKAVQYQIDSHPAIKQAQQAAASMKRSEVANRLQQEYPDFQDTVSDPSFAAWVGGSKVRAELFARADQGYDFDAAAELLGNWNERKETTKRMSEVSAIDRKQQLKAATTSVSGSSDEGVGKKVYRRADIIKLMQTDPDRYDSMQNEIMAAYKEGRVK
jgi:predicted RNA-binding protein YlqC (UPF0109 family)